MSAWGIHEVQAGSTYEARVGPLSVWCSISDRTWRFGVSRRDGAEGHAAWMEGGSPPQGLVWKTWIPPEKAGLQLGIRPVLPDRPVVIRPAEPTLVPASGRFNCFVTIPLSVGIFFGHDSGQLLVNEPVIILSSTWFGEPTNGHISYAKKSGFKQSVEDLAPSAHTVVCPLRIRNRSDEVLTIERLCLHVKYLSVYQGERFLWANESSVSYRGAREWSRLAYGQGAPGFDKASERLSVPQEIPQSRFSLRSLDIGAEQL